MTPVFFHEHTLVPGKIVCIGRNYADHISELGNEVPDAMVVFNKPASAISRELHAVLDEPLHYETELCFLLRAGKLAGVAIGLDLTKRELQNRLKQKGLPWERAKAFDGAATFSRFIDLPGPIESLSFTLHIDGRLTQQGDPALMLYPPAQILQNLSQFMSLQDNDILMTGTPAGVGQVQPGARYLGTLLYDGHPILEHEWQGLPA